MTGSPLSTKKEPKLIQWIKKQIEHCEINEKESATFTDWDQASLYKLKKAWYRSLLNKIIELRNEKAEISNL